MLSCSDAKNIERKRRVEIGRSGSCPVTSGSGCCPLASGSFPGYQTYSIEELFDQNWSASELSFDDFSDDSDSDGINLSYEKVNWFI